MIMRGNLQHSAGSAIFDADFYADLVETIRDGVCVLKSNQLILVNQAFCEILGQQREQLIEQ
jgi:PAS domain S-box-containing protein